jgi:hypothetical protein
VVTITSTGKKTCKMLVTLAQIDKDCWLPYHPLTELTIYVLFCSLDIITMTHDNNIDLKLVSFTTSATVCTVHTHRHEVMLSQMVNSIKISKKCNALIFRAQQSRVGLRKYPEV